MASESFSGGALDQAAADRGGDDFIAQDYVTPELEAKFAEVFGRADGGDDGEGEVAQSRAVARSGEREQQEELDEETLDAGELGEHGRAEGEDDQPLRAAAKPAVKAGGEPAAEDTAAVALSPVLRQAAVRAGWSKEDIDAFYTANPEVAERTFNRLQASYNDLSSRYAALGRQQPAPAQQQAPQTQQPQSPVSALDALFDPKALKEFAEANGEDIVEKVLKPLRAEVVEPLRQAMAWIAAREQEALGQEINLTFKGWEAEFGDLYGKGKDVSEQQMQARRDVGMLADQIRAGAALQGEQMSVSEALERAHMVLTAKQQATIERKRITEALKTRSARITARPTQRKVPTTAAEGAPRSDKAAMEAYMQRASELGLGVG